MYIEFNVIMIIFIYRLYNIYLCKALKALRIGYKNYSHLGSEAETQNKVIAA